MRRWAISSLCERHRVYLHKPRKYSLVHTKAIRYSLLLLGYNPVQHVTLLNTIGNCNTMVSIIIYYILLYGRSQWPHGLRRRSAAARLLRSWVRIPPGAWMFVCCECCVLSGRGLCDELITCPEESYRLWCVIVCDLETSRMRRP